MVTGIEAAGLALAVFPLVVQGIDSYVQGVQTLRNVRRYKKIFPQVHRTLQLEHTKFESTCNLFLGNFVSDRQMANLLMGNGWKDIQFQDNLLKLGLRHSHMETFKGIFNAIFLALQRLGSALEYEIVYEESQVGASRPN